MTTIWINGADMVDPRDPAGRSYREINAAMPHAIQRGALVEMESGVRLFVVLCGRDCDQTPLYWLAPDADDVVPEREGFANPKWIGGYPEESLTVISPGEVAAAAGEPRQKR